MPPKQTKPALERHFESSRLDRELLARAYEALTPEVRVRGETQVESPQCTEPPQFQPAVVAKGA